MKKREKERKQREKDRKKEAKEREKELKRKEKVGGACDARMQGHGLVCRYTSAFAERLVMSL